MEISQINTDTCWVDLHTHTTKSDGTVPPLDLLANAIKDRIKIFAITDHDSVEGIREIYSSPLDNLPPGDLKFVTGVEISAKHKGGVLHILGYGIDIENALLRDQLFKMQNIRKTRNQKILDKLNSLGIEISAEYLPGDEQTGNSVGRPHIAKMMVEKGFVGSIDEAFDDYLKKGAKAFVEKELLSPQQSIDLIHQAGGKAILAHPVTLNLGSDDFITFIKRLIKSGLDGLEVFASLHTDEQTEFFKSTALSHELLISAGSDFHGSIKPEITLGACRRGNRIKAADISEELIDLAYDVKSGD